MSRKSKPFRNIVSERFFFEFTFRKNVMVEKHNRSIVKAISWRIFGSIDTIFVSLLVTKNLKIAASIGVVEIFTKMTLYYFHERLWNKTNFGKIPVSENE
jgi:uncharacterized membrane protein